MSAGTWKIHYGFAVTPAGGGAALVAYNTGVAPSDFPADIGLNRAVGLCMAMIRRFQSIGVDAVGTVQGVPVGANASTPVIALVSPYTDVQIYAKIDTPDYTLRRAIALANKDAAAGPSIGTTDLPEDVA